ncbi:hypothetical protein PHU20_06065, partial [Maribacter sp. D37]|nr:hypothetical protein [Maribacter polysaccharolyticus]
GNSLQIDIEGGSSTSVDLSSLVGTDDQIANEVNITDTAGNFTATEVEGALAELAAASTDDQTASEVSYDNTTSGLTAVDTQAAIDELAAGSTDDQTVDALTFDSGTGELAISLEGDGAVPVTVDLSALDTDDQVASEVDSDSPVDVDGDGSTEATVEDVIQAIAPITSKAARIFYPPSIAVDASTIVNNATIDLYQEYIDQFGSPTMASTGAPAVVPTYTKTELYYYVTYADPTVLNIDSISADGVMQYDVVGTPSDYNSLINVVFVVK